MSTHEEKVRQRAHEIWQKRVAAGEESAGNAASDWFAAEAEIEEEMREAALIHRSTPPVKE